MASAKIIPKFTISNIMIANVTDLTLARRLGQGEDPGQVVGASSGRRMAEVVDVESDASVVVEVVVAVVGGAGVVEAGAGLVAGGRIASMGPNPRKVSQKLSSLNEDAPGAPDETPERSPVR